ncbi:hypothetical protein LCL89_10510 [Halobacillus yeomjeoni]|uniref:DUF6612 family protein n=1 Tax=Halobacillus yeomjeoni TaxID=311194 RepID=UPI001CD2BAA0|nr:DUF6612 family protein [Halobacillus yeomjeoni]MCA0984474.1 hypothetical protein [Halobacillus yeomjeoni]
MKKLIISTLSIMTILIFTTACSSSEGAKIEDIYQKSSEASKKLDNFLLKMESTHTLEMDDSQSSQADSPALPLGEPITSKIESKVQTEPMAYHQKVETMGQVMKQYYTPDGLYMTLPTKNGWYKAPKEVAEQLNAIDAEKQTPVSQLDSLKEFIDEFDLEEKDNYYILSLRSEGEKVKNLVDQAMKESLTGGQIPENLMDGVDFKKLSYSFSIDKETYYPHKMKVDMTFTIDQNGEKVTMNQTIDGNYSQFNEIGEISIPEDVKQKAKEIENIESLFQQ